MLDAARDAGALIATEKAGLSSCTSER